MSKRLSKLIERDGAFHDLCADHSSYDHAASRRKNDRWFSQTWKDGEEIAIGMKRDGTHVINFSPACGYYLTPEIEKDFNQVIGAIELNNKIKHMEKSGFKIPEKDLEEICKQIRKLNNGRYVKSFEELKDEKEIDTNYIGKEAVLKTEVNTLYLLKDGTCIYRGKESSMPRVNGIQKIKMRETERIASQDFVDYISQNDINFEAGLNLTGKAFPNFKIPDKRQGIVDNNLLKLLMKREFPNVKTVHNENALRYDGEEFQIIDSEGKDIVYKDATNFNLVSSDGGNVYVDIDKGYRYYTDIGEVQNEIRESIFGEVGVKLAGNWKATDIKSAKRHIFNPEIPNTYYRWQFRKSDDVLKILKEDFEKEIVKTSLNSNIQARDGFIGVISHSPYVKINGADEVYGEPPKNPIYEINCYAGHGGKTEVVYDY